LIVEYQSEIC